MTLRQVEKGDLIAFENPQGAKLRAGKFYPVKGITVLNKWPVLKNDEGVYTFVTPEEMEAWGCSRLPPSRTDGHALDIG